MRGGRTGLSPLLGLEALLQKKGGPVAVAVVGCGGKTSLIRTLALENRRRRVLISPTTKIRPTREADYHSATLAEALARPPAPGIHCAGLLNRDTGKLEGFPPGELARLAGGYELVLMEADGSKTLPCKGWRENEPVVPAWCDYTLGVVPIRALGLPATEAHVLRLAAFLALTGLEQGAPITIHALAAMAAEMFKNAAGCRILLINQADDGALCALAEELAAAQKIPGLERVIIASLQRGLYLAPGESVYKRGAL